MRKALLSILLCSSIAFGQMQWVTAYYPLNTWQGSWNPVTTQFHWNTMTHCIIFAGNTSQTAPYWNDTGMDPGGVMDSYITAGHAAGVKMLLCASGGYSNPDLPIISADVAKCSIFVKTVVDYAKLHNFDGVDLDWEFPYAADAQGWYRLIHGFRNELNTSMNPRGIFAMALHPSSFVTSYAYGTSPNSIADMVSVFDQINLMSYTMWTTGRSGYDTPVYQSTQFPTYGDCLDELVPDWIAHGIPASKTGIGIPFEGTRFTGTTSMEQTYSAWNFCSIATSSYSAGGYPSIPTQTRHWDAVAKANWCANGNYTYSYQDTNSIKAIISWAKERGYGGIMIWDMPAGMDKLLTPTDQNMHVVAREASAQVVITPTITCSPMILGFPNTVINTTSAEMTYSLSANSLSPTSGDITVTAPTGFQVSKTSGSGFASSVTYAFTNGTLASVMVYAKFIPTAVQSYTGNITNAGGGATTINVAVSGNGIAQQQATDAKKWARIRHD